MENHSFFPAPPLNPRGHRSILFYHSACFPAFAWPRTDGERTWIPLIVLENVSYRVPSGAFALQNISLTVWDCENLSISGPPGCGKSTLLKLMAGLLFPDEGTIRVDGEALTPDSLPALSKKLGYAGQLPARPGAATVGELLRKGPLSCGFSQKEAELLSDYALKSLKLTELAEKKLSELSFSQRRAAELAAAVAKQPSVLLLDEPLQTLWPAPKRGFFTTLELHPHTKIIASNNLDLPLLLCSRVVLMKEGSILAYGDPASLLSDLPLLARMNLELPALFQRRGIY